MIAELTPRDFIEQYRSAFANGDVEALLGCFAFPLQVVTIVDGRSSVSFSNEDGWPEVLQGLVSSYRRLDVDDAVPLELEISQPMEAVALVRVRWALQRADGSLVYDFSAVYTLARPAIEWRIVTILHDEQPKMMAALAEI